MSTAETPQRFRLAYVPGATPAKWVRIWQDRRPDVPLDLVPLAVADTAAAIADGAVDMAITRLPDALGHADPGPHHTISLYDETTVVVMPKDHGLSAGDELASADVVDEQFLWPADAPIVVDDPPGIAVDHRPDTTADGVELVAAGIGLLMVPQSLARLHHRKDLVYRPMPEAPTSTVGLLWQDPTTPLVDEFIGIVRGRRATSSRGDAEPARKRTAKEKTAAKQAARAAAGTTPRRGKRRAPAKKRRSR